MSAEKDQSMEIPEYVMAEIQKILDLILDPSEKEDVEIINLGSLDGTVEEMEMMALLHYLNKGLPLPEAEKRAKELVKEHLEIERLFEKKKCQSL